MFCTKSTYSEHCLVRPLSGETTRLESLQISSDKPSFRYNGTCHQRPPVLTDHSCMVIGVVFQHRFHYSVIVMAHIIFLVLTFDFRLLWFVWCFVQSFMQDFMRTHTNVLSRLYFVLSYFCHILACEACISLNIICIYCLLTYVLTSITHSSQTEFIVRFHFSVPFCSDFVFHLF